MFAHSLFYLTHRWDPIWCYHSGSEWLRKQWQWRGAPHSTNLQGWNLTIRWFKVINRACIWEGVTRLQSCSRCFLQPGNTCVVRDSVWFKYWRHIRIHKNHILQTDPINPLQNSSHIFLICHKFCKSAR